jgi:hypothetical protein
MSALPSTGAFAEPREAITCFGPEAWATISAVYPNDPATFDHGLRAHPLLTLDALAALGEALPATSVEYNLADIDVSTLPDDAPTNGLGIGDTIRTIAANKSWAVLKNVEQIPAYRDLIATLLGELDDTVAARTGSMLTLQGYVFVSSPGSMTPYHFDPEHNILLQLRGEKTMHVWPGGDPRFAAQVEHERYHGGGHRGLPWDEAWESDAFVADLVPGRAVLVPVMAPHYVRNGPEPSISLSITWRSEWSYRESEAHAANRWLRARGLSPAMPPRWPQYARAKTLAWRAARRLGLVG